MPKLFGGGSASVNFHLVGNTRRFVRYDEAGAMRWSGKYQRCAGFVDARKIHHSCPVLLERDPDKPNARCRVCDTEHKVLTGSLVKCACGELVARGVSYCDDCKARGVSKRSRILRLAKSRLTYQQIAARTGASYPYVARVMAQIKTAPVI